MNFVLPLCPTTNSMYSKSRYGVYKTQEARNWEKEAQVAILQTKGRKTLTGSVYVGIEFFLKRDRDVDNLKLVLDALEDNQIVKNDSQVVHLNIKKYVDKKNPRIEVQVEEVELVNNL